MTRTRALSAAWTVLVVAGATLALAGIVAFMARVHDAIDLTGGAPADAGVASGRVDEARGPGAPASRAPVDVPAPGPPRSPSAPSGDGRPEGTEPAVPAAPPAATATIEALRGRSLTMPVRGVLASALVPSFAEARGDRRHEALDIMAPTGTPVVAVEDGTIAKLFTSKAGGLTIYQFDPSAAVAYYYAHLDRYAPGLGEGAAVRRGQVIGYVGATGNADPKAPHLHFAIFQLGPERRWWEGTPIDPYLVLRQ